MRKVVVEKVFCRRKSCCVVDFYRAMHFSAKRGIAIACRLSVCLSVRLSVCLWTLVDCDHIGWNSSKIISPLVSMGCSLFATPTWRVCSKGNTPKFGPKVTHPPVDLSVGKIRSQIAAEWLQIAQRSQQESPAIADKSARRESVPKIAPIRRAYNVVADNTGLSSFV